MKRCSASWAFGLALACAVGARGDDDSPEAVLKAKGLVRSGTAYVLPAEGKLQKGLTAARDRYKQFSIAQRQQQMFEQGTRDSKAMTRELTQQRLMLTRELNFATNTADRNRVVLMMNEVTDQLNLLNQNADDPEARKTVVARTAELREAFMQSVLDARGLADAAGKAYADVAGDAEVKAAIEALNRKTKAKFTLGPSRAFLANLKLLEKVERTVMTEDVPLREENGVFSVDVTFNGKVTKAMYLDTGASLVSLSAKVAREIGLKPDAGTPTVKTQIADGSTVQARLMKIPTVRVGKFTVADVECLIAPAGKDDAPLLLGGSFLKHFVYHIRPDAEKLVLTRVDTGDAPAAAPGGPRGKGAARVPSGSVKGKRAPKPAAPAEAEGGDESPAAAPAPGDEFAAPKGRPETRRKGEIP